MDAAERKKLERERDRFVLAESDMRQVEGAASHLDARGSQMNDGAHRVMWTGLVVTYARPFSPRNRLGVISGRLARPSDDLRPLHRNLLDRRDDLFAHNDVTE